MDAAAMQITIYNLPPSPAKWDVVGIFYITFCVTWTTLVFAGMAFCWFNRRSPVLRIRGLPLSFASITFLHCYWCLAQITYPVGMTMPIVLAYDIQYFFMGIWFPLGIALFHASNLRFLYVAKLQKQFTRPELRSRHECNGAADSWLCRLRCMNYTKRILIFIGGAMIIQVLLTIGMWMACKKYHPTFGIPGTEIRGESLMEQIVDLGRGWEWWPSVLWQVIWTWIVAPFLIYRSWSIRDTMGWRVQTVGCCLASLHATPMFMIATYIPAFATINMYYHPSQWIHLSIMFFEIFTVFIPVLQTLKHKSMTKKTANSSEKRRAASRASTLRMPTSPIDANFGACSCAEKGQFMDLDMTDEDLGDRLLTMTALEHVLESNPAPLQEFSALSDFSGENIAFLTHVSAWKAAAAHAISEQSRKATYGRALAIYADFISPRDAEFPLNLPSQELRQLEVVFERSTRAVLGEASANLATPFDDLSLTTSRHGFGEDGSDIGARFTGEVPDIFDLYVFDKAASHIKYLVLTNTWPKFVAEMRQRRKSDETERTARSGLTSSSGTTFASRLSSKASIIFPKLRSL